MNIKFIKDYGNYKAGQVLEGCFRNGALALVADGTAIEVNGIGEPVAQARQAKPEPPKAEPTTAGKQGQN